VFFLNFKQTQAIGWLFASLGFVPGVVDCFVAFFGTEESVFASRLDKFTSAVMHATGISTNTSDTFVFKDLNFPQKALAVNVIIALWPAQLLLAYTDVFNLLAAVAIHDITSRHERFLSSQNERSVRFLLTYYDQMCTKINNINAINTGVMLIVYVRLVAWISISSLDLMESSNWVWRALVFTKYILHASAFMLAADANKKVKLTIKTI